MKQTKASVNYRQGREPRRCDNCTMYQFSPGAATCTAVAGAIAPGAVCDLFKLRATRNVTEKET